MCPKIRTSQLFHEHLRLLIPQMHGQVDAFLAMRDAIQENKMNEAGELIAMVCGGRFTNSGRNMRDVHVAEDEHRGASLHTVVDRQRQECRAQ